MQAIAQPVSRSAARVDPVPTGAFAVAEPPLAIRVLPTPEARMAIVGLRKLSASAVEDDLGFGLGPFETVRDQIGMVAAIEREGRAIATIRFVPSGHGMTGLERLQPEAALPAGIVTAHSWEVGRLIVAPEHRHPELLGQCFTLALAELVRTRRVERFYAIATPLMARLWRRFGMKVAATVRGASGTEYAVVSGRAADVAAALDRPAPLPGHGRALPVREAAQSMHAQLVH